MPRAWLARCGTCSDRWPVARSQRPMNVRSAWVGSRACGADIDLGRPQPGTDLPRRGRLGLATSEREDSTEKVFEHHLRQRSGRRRAVDVTSRAP